MKRKGRIILIIILVLILLASVFIYKQWNNISAFVDALRYSKEDIETNLQQNEETLKNIVEQENGYTIRDLTEEEAKAIADGTMTEQELVDKIVQKKEDPPVPPSGEVTPSETAKPPAENKPSGAEPDAAEALTKQVARLYVQKSYYMNKLDEIEAKVHDEYLAISKEERRENRQNIKKEFINRYISTVAAWEAECDGAVYAILDEIRVELKKLNQSEDFVNQIEDAYLNEKKAKKAYFINRYMD